MIAQASPGCTLITTIEENGCHYDYWVIHSLGIHQMEVCYILKLVHMLEGIDREVVPKTMGWIHKES